MLDLETMGTNPSAAIIAIGAIAFDLETGQLGRTFLQAVDLGNSMLNGGIVDANTVEWWMKQSDDAKRVFFDEERRGIYDSLMSFFSFLAISTTCKDGDVKMWGNGSDFDNVILRNAYERCGIKPHWKFRNNRCYRTVKNLFPDIPFVCGGIAHNALDDARNQAKHLIAMIGGNQ